MRADAAAPPGTRAVAGQLSGWFVTSQFEGVKRIAGEYRAVPASVAHAKRMGTLLTACGLNAVTWRKFWDHPFVSGSMPRCSQCESALSQRQPGNQRLLP